MFLWIVIFFITVNGQTVRVQSPVAIQGFCLLTNFLYLVV